MNRRDFSIGGFVATVAGIFGIRTEAAAKDTVQVAPIIVQPVEYKSDIDASVTDEDGNYFAMQELAHTRDCSDFIFKVYPAALLRELVLGNQIDVSPDNQAVYVRGEVNGVIMAVKGQGWVKEALDEEFERFRQSYYEWKDSGFIGNVNDMFTLRNEFTTQAVMEILN